MLELTARVLVSRSDQMRGIIRDRDSEFRTYYLKEMARQLAQALMETKGAVEISEYMNPETGDLEMRGRVFVDDSRMGRAMDRMTASDVRRRKESGVQDMMDAMRYAMPQFVFTPPDFKPTLMVEPDPSRDPRNDVLTLEKVKALQKKMELEMLKGMSIADPVEFLQSRIDRKKGIDEVIESSKARVRADNQIRNSTRTPGEALPVVKVKVRKIQMSEEA